MRTVAFIPYFGGIGPKAPSPVDKRPKYLSDTVKSLQGFADLIWVGVARPGDEHTAVRSGDVIVTRLDCDPRFIPLELMRQAQRDGLTDDFDAVYVTEADQILHLDREFYAPVGVDYLIPHRLEELGPGGEGAHRGPLFDYDGKRWVTGERPAPPAVSPPTLYRPQGPVDGYGGAYWCSAEFFRTLDFQPDQNFCVESVTGFTPHYAGRGWKTTTWEMCFVEHLSGYDYHCTLAPG